MLSVIVTLAFAAASGNMVADSSAKPAKPKKVCEKVEVTGSTVPKRVCRTVIEPSKPKEEATQAVTDKSAAGATY